MPESPQPHQPHPEQRFQRTPGLAALFHQIRYDVNNKGVKPENLNTYAYLRVFSQMGEEYAQYSSVKHAQIPSASEQALKLQEFGRDGFNAVIEVAKTTAGITDEQLEAVTREEQRIGLEGFTSLSPFIESLEEETPSLLAEGDTRALRAYLRTVHEAIAIDPLFVQKE